MNDADKTGFNTDDVPETATNQYFTDNRARSAVSSVGYLTSAGQIDITQTSGYSGVTTLISASDAARVALSSSVDSRLDTLEGSGSIQAVGTANNVTFNTVTASAFVGDGSKLTNVVISAANNYDFNTDPSAGYIGYLENSGSTIYNITPTTASIEFRKDGTKFAEITQALGFSGSLYGIGDVLAFSSSVSSRLASLETTIDAGTF